MRARRKVAYSYGQSLFLGCLGDRRQIISFCADIDTSVHVCPLHWSTPSLAFHTHFQGSRCSLCPMLVTFYFFGVFLFKVHFYINHIYLAALPFLSLELGLVSISEVERVERG